LEADPAVRDALPGGPARTARLLGYLAQRAIGYGLRWRGEVEGCGAVSARTGRAVPGWSPIATVALRQAHARARARGADRTEGLDLLAALTHDHRSRAVDVLLRSGVDPVLLVARLENRTRPAAG
ncbi:peptidase, partial [Streptomyces sp. NPDC049577]|uniref:peptidase n=1 Tax=Streptomyces sp. NPDC049577 TaxID=3155153 RepID=UPI00341D9C73